MNLRTIGKPDWRSSIGLVFAVWLLSVIPLGTLLQAKESNRSPASPASSVRQIDHTAADEAPVIELVAAEGDTLYRMLGRAGVGAAGRAAVIDALEGQFDPRALRPGDKVRLVLQARDHDVIVRSLRLERGAGEDLTINVTAPKAKRTGIRQITFAPPLKGGQITSLFGWRIHPVFGDWRFHKGVDFRAPKGTPVSASADGVVAEVGWRGNYGKYVRIRHSAAVETTYSHLSAYARGLRAGKRVRQGQVIGYVGRSGVATGNHLYYEMIVKGQYIDPLHPPAIIAAHPGDEQLSEIRASVSESPRN